MSSEKLVELTDGSFDQEVLQSELPVLVDFGAEWCMPCKMLAPTMDELADEYAGRVKVATVDTDSCRETALKLQISAIPTVILFKGGHPTKKFVGLQQKRDFKTAIDEALE